MDFHDSQVSQAIWRPDESDGAHALGLVLEWEGICADRKKWYGFKMTELNVERMASARLPLDEGDFQLCLYRNNRDGLDHLAFVLGDVAGKEGVLTRIHSECFTGDVAGSLRCDCGAQLQSALRAIGATGCGVLIYLRQEGRGIGLLEKLRAYNLQDEGWDTVDANLQLGHAADAREYGTAALILAELRPTSIDLITNNPEKLKALREMGIKVRSRVPLQVEIARESLEYMRTKIQRMEHLLQLEGPDSLKVRSRKNSSPEDLEDWLSQRHLPSDRPLVTLAYAQSLDGSIAHPSAPSAPLSGPEAQLLSHRLRRWHDGILVGMGPVFSNEPQQTVRLLPGRSPSPMGREAPMRFSLDTRLALREMMAQLNQMGIRKLLVEGDADLLACFFRERMGDLAVVTIVPKWTGGSTGAFSPADLPQLIEPVWSPSGQELMMWSDLSWSAH